MIKCSIIMFLNLCWIINASKIRGYTRNCYIKTDYISFVIEDDELLKKCNKIWNKVSNSINKEFDGHTVYNEKYLRTKKILSR